MASPSPLQAEGEAEPEAAAAAVIKEISRGYELSSQLHSLLREIVPRGDGRLEAACRLSKDVQQSLASALSILRPSGGGGGNNSNHHDLNRSRAVARFRASDPLALEISLPTCSASGDDDSRTSTTAAARDHLRFNTSRKRDYLQSGTTISYETYDEVPHCKLVKEKKISKTEKQRNLYSWTTTTCTPFNDGHQWRKYGEKKISHSKMPRCYYRCTHKDDQGCPATKQVQQKDSEDPPTFVVTYNKQHTCRNISPVVSQQFVVEPPIRDPCQLSLS